MERTTGNSSRATSRSSAATRERLLDAAEALFAERGFTGTSLRAATERAGANVAAVNYHFRSKEGLLRAVITRAVGPMNQRRRQLLDKLEEDDTTPTIEQLVHAFVSTGIHLIPTPNETTDPTTAHHEHGEHTARFIGRVISDPSPQMRTIFSDEVRDVEGRYKEAVIRALPHLPRNEAVLRHTAMIGLLGLWQSGALLDLNPNENPSEDSPDTETRLITYLVAGFRAPAT
ncbi:TetR/AcrR family transcriptional regulator [Streptomyces sp. NPDC048172]|uniref:TetR/AcrR family transcriptional regulator n=1 Tax=Streptomyces sp. NPDC048172 TaxID=3365505 RepID=UPI0037113689